MQRLKIVSPSVTYSNPKGIVENGFNKSAQFEEMR